MNITDLQGKQVAVLGYSQEGRALTKYLAGFGVKPTIFDKKNWSELDLQVRQEIQDLGLTPICGADYLKELKGFDVIFRSPGVKCLEPEIVTAVEKGAVLTSQAEWFFENCPAKIIGITGTNGKGTTSSLIYEMLKKTHLPAESEIYLTGNIGGLQPVEFLERLQASDWVVYELSSFQLQDMKKSPHIAVVLKITPDHLDYHKTMEEYVQAKSNIAKYQGASDQVIYNFDNEPARAIGQASLAQKIFFSNHNENANALIAEDRLEIRNSDGQYENIISLKEMKLRGVHNLENAAAACLAAQAVGVNTSIMRQVLQSFAGLPHRLEYVGESAGVKFYDDSIATTPEPAIAAINSFSENLILFLGGSFKGSDFSSMAQVVKARSNIKAVMLMGQETDRIAKSLADAQASVAQIKIQTLAEGFDWLRKNASAGDVVLLSPACASFGMFSNYKERGDKFKELAKNFQRT